MNRRTLLRTLVGGGMATWYAAPGSSLRSAGETQLPATRGRRSGADRGPIIDVHMHAYPAEAAIPPSANRLTGKPHDLKDGRAHFQACVREMQRLNIVKGVVSGGSGDRLAAALHWQESDPERFLAGASLRGSDDTPLPEIALLRKGLVERRLHVLGEVTAQYAGLSLSDSQYAPYLELAEELDLPVSLHTGPGPAGISYDPCCSGFRARLGNPALIEEALNRYPKVRVNLMHAGWPYLADTIATVRTYPQVNVDLGWLAWGLPRPEFHAYLAALMRAGLGNRIMFGSDHMYWPETIGMAVDGVDSATFLSKSETRDIFYGNAVRFFRLEPPD